MPSIVQADDLAIEDSILHTEPGVAQFGEIPKVVAVVRYQAHVPALNVGRWQFLIGVHLSTASVLFASETLQAGDEAILHRR